MCKGFYNAVVKGLRYFSLTERLQVGYWLSCDSKVCVIHIR